MLDSDEYPTMTRLSPRGRTREVAGKVMNQGGKRKVKISEPKQFVPLKGDTPSGYGEKRKRYIR